MAEDKKKKVEETLPTVEEAKLRFALAYAPALESFRRRLNVLAAHAPQVLHLEGGTAEERIAFAFYWAALLNCENTVLGSAEPCLECSSCLRTGAGMNSDVLIFDGRENSVKVDVVRELKAKIAEPPRFAKVRVVLFLEAQNLNTNASNASLKMLEEPSAHTKFLFTISQRENLLPTIVSRGFVLTLPWVRTPMSEQKEEWSAILTGFFRTGAGLFEHSAAKGAVTPLLTEHIVLLLQSAFAERLSGRAQTELGRLFQTMPDASIPEADSLLEKAQNALRTSPTPTNPSYVLESLVTGLFCLLIRNK